MSDDDLMDEKIQYLNSLSNTRLNSLKREWKNVLQKFPDYKLAKQEIRILSEILWSRGMHF